MAVETPKVRDKVKAVAVVNEEQRETIMTLFKGCGKAHALLLVDLQHGDRTERCPGAIGGRLVFKQVAFTRACSAGLDAPRPKVQIVGGRVGLQKNLVVLRRFLDKDTWNQVFKAPQRRCWMTWPGTA